MEMFSSALQGRRLDGAVAIDADSLVLDSVPASLAAGAYRLRIDAEIIRGTTTGTASFTDLERGLEGTSAAAHRSGVLVRHVITGDSLQQLLTVATQDGLQSLGGVRTIRVPDGSLVVDGTTATILSSGAGARTQPPAARPVASRLYLFTNFT